jgi:hypothetical protein
MSKYIKVINRRIEQKSKNGPYFDLTICQGIKKYQTPVQLNNFVTWMDSFPLIFLLFID